MNALEVINTFEKGDTNAASTMWTVYKEDAVYPVCACYNGWEKLLAEETLDVLIRGEVVKTRLNPVATENGKSSVDIMVRMPEDNAPEMFSGISAILAGLNVNGD